MHACGSRGQTKDKRVRRESPGSSEGACRPGFRDHPEVVSGESAQRGLTHPAGVRTHPRRSAGILGSGLGTTASCRLWAAEHAGPPWRRDDLSRPQNRPACRIAPPAELLRPRFQARRRRKLKGWTRDLGGVIQRAGWGSLGRKIRSEVF